MLARGNTYRDQVEVMATTRYLATILVSLLLAVSAIDWGLLWRSQEPCRFWHRRRLP